VEAVAAMMELHIVLPEGQTIIERFRRTGPAGPIRRAAPEGAAHIELVSELSSFKAAGSIHLE